MMISMPSESRLVHILANCNPYFSSACTVVLEVSIHNLWYKNGSPFRVVTIVILSDVLCVILLHLPPHLAPCPLQ